GALMPHLSGTSWRCAAVISQRRTEAGVRECTWNHGEPAGRKGWHTERHSWPGVAIDNAPQDRPVVGSTDLRPANNAAEFPRTHCHARKRRSGIAPDPQNSEERTRLACWRWRPRHRELSQRRETYGELR